MKNVFCSIVLCFLVFFKMSSQTCCSGGVPLSNNLGMPNEGKNSLTVGLSYDYNNLNTLNTGSQKRNDDSRLRITNSILLNTAYSFTDRLSVETLFTWVNQKRTISQFGNENFTETSGLGDAVFLLKYAMPNILGKEVLLNFGLGAKIPLGKSDVVSEQGIQLTADLQPGSGALDGIGWLSVSKKLNFRPSAIVFGSFIYRLTGVNNSYLNNTSTYQFGNELRLDVGYSDQFLLHKTLFSGGVSLRYRKSSRDKISDVYLPNTGGNWVFVKPELSVHATPRFTFNTKLELPVYSNVDGTQLTPTARLTFGVIAKFNIKKESQFLNF